MNVTALQFTWFALIGVLMSLYLILDGFDLGVGIRYLFERDKGDRRTMLTLIGPFWDGNEVWLLTAAGALFAAFPPVYASVFSGMSLALLFVLVGLIIRAVAIEFRGRSPGAAWGKTWDAAFAVGSIIPALLLGVAMGNLLGGMELNQEGYYVGGFLALLNPYSILIGLTGLVMLAAHGGAYLAARADGELAKRSLNWAKSMSVLYLLGFAVAAATTCIAHPRLLENFVELRVLWLLPAGALGAIIACVACLWAGKAARAFACSSVSILLVIAMMGAALFPELVPAAYHREWSLRVGETSSSQLTLKIMLIMTCLGLPFVLGYTIWIYRTFTRPENQ